MKLETGPYRYFHKLLKVQLWFIYAFATRPRLKAFMENLVGKKNNDENYVLIHPNSPACLDGTCKHRMCPKQNPPRRRCACTEAFSNVIER